MNPKMLSNNDLLARVKQLAEGERVATAALVAHLVELDERRLYLSEGYSSLFTYCTHILHLSEHAAYGRIEAARAARRFPIILERLEDGSVNLTTVSLLAAHFTAENHHELLDMARHMSKRQVEELVARMHPQPPIAPSVRRLPTARPALVNPAPATRSGPSSAMLIPDSPSPRVSIRTRPAVSPLAPQHYKVQFTATPEMVEKLRLAQNLLRHQAPDGDVATIFEMALTALLDKLMKRKLATTDRPRGGRAMRPESRHIPAAVRREVWLRDTGRCAFVSTSGRRCDEGGFLELHHVIPYAAGGKATAGNIQLQCRAHNGHEAELFFTMKTRGKVVEERSSGSSAEGKQFGR